MRLKEGANDESVSRMEYIQFPPTLFQTVDKNEYVSYDFLKNYTIRIVNNYDVKISRNETAINK